jgi:hypothetical protein
LEDIVDWLDLKRLMFKNSDSDIDTEVGHTCSGRVLREFHLENMFKKNYGDEGFYRGEEADLTYKENLEPTRSEEGKDEEPRRDEPETSGTVQTIEVSTIIPPVHSTTLSNQSHQSIQSIVTSSSTYTQSGNLRRYMADEMRLPIFRGDGSEDPDQHQFLCDTVWNIKNVTDEAVKRT